MIRMLINLAINVASAAIGLLASAILLPGFDLQVRGFLAAAAVLSIAQTVLGPFVFTMARKYATAMLGGIGIVSTLIALVIANLVPGGVSVNGFSTWILAALIIWLCMALGGWLLVALFLKKRTAQAT
ncbi:MAG TPA: phage holin family protein [Propionibacteriaceae bacterium]|nr:phage holin family protein [Propionibacteriaceae bacterium]